MTRNIKFRAKVLNSSNWIYRQPFHVRGTWYMYNSLWDMVPIDYKTLGQYTGLKDKNGKEIYEGDVLLFNNDYPNAQKMDWKCVVKYRKGSFVCEYPKDGVYNHFDSWNVPKVTWEVIGNIYENPSLLEVME
ncbi:YopX family protein [Heyndrickxia sporothermodurans]|uniref:YopX family protein n=1 Tax=Heyndrickxia sporothermodurans TaxID=46224 RepID=UPI002DB7B8E9|nr:YopX family protein [Heyndrickxia sporothermodurans]MEB6549109.1 YopX family protein [Heyndrickxia sporothermodurans]